VAYHRVRFAIPQKEIGNVDLEIEVTSNGTRLGRLLISRGGLDWYPSKASRKRRFGWMRLARTLNAASAKRRRPRRQS
jgi:hypothetical protein